MTSARGTNTHATHSVPSTLALTFPPPNRSPQHTPLILFFSVSKTFRGQFDFPFLRGRNLPQNYDASYLNFCFIFSSSFVFLISAQCLSDIMIDQPPSPTIPLHSLPFYLTLTRPPHALLNSTVSLPYLSTLTPYIISFPLTGMSLSSPPTSII